MRVIPGMTVIVPCDAKETERAVMAAAQIEGPVYLRLARLPSPVFEEEMPFEVGKANVLREGKSAAVIACGIMVAPVLECAKRLEKEGISLTVINMHTIKPIDRECIVKYANQCGRIITVEEHSVIGGLGSAVAEVLGKKAPRKIAMVGMQDTFGESGKPAQLLEKYGMTAKDIVKAVEENI